MKKFPVLLIALSLLLTLAACGSNDDDVRGSVADPNSTTPSADGASGQDGSADSGGGQADGTDYEVGSMNGGVYTNNFIGIGCTLDENWTYYSDEQLLELNGLVADAVQDEDLSEMLKNNEVIYDMYAAADDGIVTMNICFENLGVLYGTTLDESSYIDIATENAITALESMGYSSVSNEKKSVEFAGAERQCLSITGTIQDVPCYEEVICIKQGNYMAVITLASFYENILEDLRGLFYAV